ncbi:MAG: glycoside hydrolase family 95 protein [Bacteroidota bacterium]|nr:glycoside hydrolase family 95 protein [Bacteroidota bacterium]
MKTVLRAQLVLTLAILFFGCNSMNNDPGTRYHLWYDEPASEWTDALPVGNGRLGAMVFGDPNNERIQFNEESLWAGCKIDNSNPQALEHLPEIQKLIFEGRYSEAYKMSNNYLLGTPPGIRSHQTFGDMFLKYHWEDEVRNYTRNLTLNSGLARTSYDVGENHIVQEVFASAPDDILVIRIAADEAFDIDLQMAREKDARIEYFAEGKMLMSGQIIDPEQAMRGPAGAHMKFAAQAMVESKGGSVDKTASWLSYKSVNELTIYLTAATNYDINKLNFSESIDPIYECETILGDIEGKSFTQIKKQHIADHSEIFDRVSFDLGDDSFDNLPTNERLSLIKEGDIDRGLVTTYFQFGRYLLMGSSRLPGVLPANLQGLWNEHLNAPWNADFHTNINLQMNYWPAEVCNLSETSLVLTGFMEKLIVPASVTARIMYGTNGWTFHHLTDPFGRTGVADGVWGITPLDGPWMTFPVFRHYEFTGDTEYLTRIYPLLKGSAEFVKGFLVESPEGYMVTNPSHSPENAFFVPGTEKQERSSLTYAATTDIQIINELFDIIIKASGILDVDHEFAKELEAIRKKVPPVQIGENGTIQEWIHDYEEVEIGHRHMSHLLGLYPLAQITEESPQLFEAAKKTIQRRLVSGGGHTGWSRAWIVSFFSRLHDGEQAWNHLQLLLAKSTKNNLFDNHPPFQIDGNFGGTAGIAEMLLQSHSGIIQLLPALPKAWPNGHITGLKARTGFECDIWWEEGVLTKAVIRSENGGTAKIKYKSDVVEVEIEPGKEYVYNN